MSQPMHATPVHSPRTPQHAPVALGHYYGPDLVCAFCGADWWDQREDPHPCIPQSEEALIRHRKHRGYKRRSRDAVGATTTTKGESP